MAWIKEGKGGRWVEREERGRMIDERKELMATIDENFPSIEDKETNGVLVDYFNLAKELTRLERIHRCELDSYEFALEYFSENRNPENEGNWDGFDVRVKEEGPRFHREMTAITDLVSNEETNAKIALGAPRGHAKSTYYTKNFPIKEIVYRKRKYIIIISETPNVSEANMDWIRGQLKYNKKLREDFGPILHPEGNNSEKDNSEKFIAWHLDEDGHKKYVALLESASVGKAIRGRSWNGYRPDLVVGDDLEDARSGGNASTPEQRSKLKDWFTQSIMALGDPKGERTAYVIIGTTVHFDSLLMDLLHRRSDFKTRIYRAIEKEPERMDLWETCRAIYTNIENVDRGEEAYQFYKDNEEEMLRGSKVLWEDVQPLWKLMTWKWDNSSKAFNTEYMNNPIDEESMIFNPNDFTYWNEHMRNKQFEHNDYEITMGIDFAMGKRERGDYSAIVTVARDKETDARYVIDAWGDRIHPDQFLRVITNKVIEYQPDAIGAEAQMAQEFFVDKLKEYLHYEGYPPTRVKKIQQRNRKELRIEALLPDIENGKLQFNTSHSLLIEQLERFGQGGHDDLPDALEMAIRVNGTSRRRVRAKPTYF